MQLVHIILPVHLVASVYAATYSLSDNWVGSGFLNGFTFETIADPTDGRVTYVDQATAVSKNLTYTSSDTFIMRADDTTVLASSDPGRDSVRIKSDNTYTTHVAVFDIRHMPQGCATWPAVWETLESDWPNAGEVDIVEGVNDQTPNQSTLHTSAGCTMPDGIAQTGTVSSQDCNVADNGNSGCGVKAPSTNSYGPDFNSNGGGWYAMERTTSFIKVWFWARNDGSVPSDMSSGATTVDTDNWGEPTAYFPNTDCDLASHFGENNIIINLTLCGDWAGAVFNADGCPGDCTTYVNENPSAFSQAYFDFAAARVYE
ncbi:endo-1,3(4)-beta-glucanase-like protein [Heliocybe sulcata]|uniref:Endo-1,3(4)-beta-glucanase-like protein n=1 Tax=Heliocybe sulcata TaxID=5364 RepID=A0A5C3MYK3_9AGAM|nr:endo-1,3(4)-beta-glucanase-like protein [Heliocybe sulcata]